MDLLPVINDTVSGYITGFNINMVNANLSILKESGYFSKEFIDNYKKLILALDLKIKSYEYDEWEISDFPPFKFANSISPWCLCQGFLTDTIYTIQIVQINDVSAEINWKWSEDSSWRDFKIQIIKEDNRWKISYLEGFDYAEGIKKDGEV